jgi:hypothetical protein
MIDNRQRSVVGGRRSAVGSYRSPSLALFFYLCLAVITTHPLWLHLADAVPGDIGDPLLNTWILAWDSHALLTDPLHLFDANIFYPLPHTLAYSEHLLSTAALVLPLGLVSGEPVVAYNLSLLLSFPLAGLGMYLLVLHWTRWRQAAFLAGLAFAFAPYRLASIAHLQLLSIQWLPFSLLALDRLLDLGVGNREYGVGSREYGVGRGKQGAGKRIRAFVLRPSSFVIFTTLQILASWYLAVFTVLVLGLYTLGWWVARWRRGGRPVPQDLAGPVPQSTAELVPQSLAGLVPQSTAGLVISVFVVAGLTLPFALPYLDVLPQLQAARPASLAASFAAHPADFLAAAPFLRIAGPLTQRLAQRPGFTEENTLFLGFVTPLLALAGLALAGARRVERWRILALAAILVTSVTLTFAGPYRALTRLLPALMVVRVPPRWIIPATFALAALAGYGVAWMKGSGDQGLRDSGTQGLRTQELGDSEVQEEGSPDSPVPESLIPESLTLRLVFMVGASLMMIAESFSAPLPLAPVGAKADLPPVYHALAGEVLRRPPGWAVVELPMHVAPAPEFPETKRLYASTLGWWGLVNGYSGLTPERQIALGRALADFPSSEALAALRALGASGVRYLVIHPGEAPLDRARWETTDRWRAEHQTTLLPVGRFGPDDLYRINPYGDDLVTNPSIVTDPYWSTHAPHPVNIRFTLPNSNAEIRLLAYLVQSGDWKAGELEDWKVGSGALFQPSSLPAFQPSNLPTEARLTLYWQTSTSLDTSYTVFVHSLNTQEELIGQADGPPVANYYPTTAWDPGEVVQDNRSVPAGDHYLVGLYNPATGERLPAFTANGTRLADDAVVLSAGQR